MQRDQMPVRRIRIGAQDDLVDQPAQQISRLGPGAVFVQGCGEIGHFAGVNVCDAGMDRD
ncbi:MAG: hypothetical protein U0934_20765 [Pseudotabrizicola sp.]|uniref:hypothetical protein n=1 Tax=Pseudotabrizicola sp. TaxID=2939647 RepID=UPI002730EB06|nr:hypothetical protein [Pseudotabrizicola sp.]MDZ7576358.1 hypothetical protein [Pseudotabrizicola sp.]